MTIDVHVSLQSLAEHRDPLRERLTGEVDGAIVERTPATLQETFQRASIGPLDRDRRKVLVEDGEVVMLTQQSRKLGEISASRLHRARREVFEQAVLETSVLRPLADFVQSLGVRGSAAVRERSAPATVGPHGTRDEV